MPKKALVDSTLWLWIGLVVTLLVFFLLFMFQQAGQRLVQSSIDINDNPNYDPLYRDGRSGGAGSTGGFSTYNDHNENLFDTMIIES